MAGVSGAIADSGTAVPPLVDVAWLSARLAEPSLRIIDGSFHLPGSGRDPRRDYQQIHIPGGRFFDIDAICDLASPLPHMLPTPEAFGAAVGALGIGNQHHIVVYDAPGSASSARVWWTFAVFGYDRVSILDGGLTSWLAAGLPTSDEATVIVAETFTAEWRPALVCDAAAVLATLRGSSVQIIDNRPAGRYHGEQPEPRPVTKRGHIPGSINLPFSDFFDPSHPGVWRAPAALRALFANARVIVDQPMIAYCGSGVTAATTAFAARLIDATPVSVYDGSWAEWGNLADVPVEC